jgi:DNA-binding protein HU-beta
VAQAKPEKAMSKTQVAAHLAEKFNLTKRQASEILDELSDLAYTETRDKGEFTIPGIGKLVRQQRAERQGRNPSTGLPITIAAKSVVKFRVAKAAKDSILPAE